MIYISKDVVSDIYIQRNGNCGGNCCGDLKIKCEQETQTKNITVTENGSYIINPDEGYLLSQASVDVDVPQREYKSEYLDVTENGDYYAYEHGVDGFSQVHVDVPDSGHTEEELEQKYEEGKKDGYDEGLNEGIEKGKSEQKGLMTELNVTANGTYSREDGYSKVNVNVEGSDFSTKEITITSNGVYEASEDDVDGYSKVVVNVPQEHTDDSLFTRLLNGATDRLTEITIDMIDESIPFFFRKYAFYGNEYLKSIQMYDKWGPTESMCENNKNLERVEIIGTRSEELTGNYSIFSGAFRGCSAINSITLTHTYSVDEEAFKDALAEGTDVSFPSLYIVDKNAFMNSKLKSFTILDISQNYNYGKKIDIRYGAFENSKIESFNVGKGIKFVTLGGNAFKGCKNLSKLGNEDTIFELNKAESYYPDGGYEFAGISENVDGPETINLCGHLNKFSLSNGSFKKIVVHGYPYESLSAGSLDVQAFNRNGTPSLVKRIDYMATRPGEITGEGDTFVDLPEGGEFHVKVGADKGIETLFKQYKPFNTWSFIYDLQ